MNLTEIKRNWASVNLNPASDDNRPPVEDNRPPVETKPKGDSVYASSLAKQKKAQSTGKRYDDREVMVHYVDKYYKDRDWEDGRSSKQMVVSFSYIFDGKIDVDANGKPEKFVEIMLAEGCSMKVGKGIATFQQSPDSTGVLQWYLSKLRPQDPSLATQRELLRYKAELAHEFGLTLTF